MASSLSDGALPGRWLHRRAGTVPEHEIAGYMATRGAVTLTSAELMTLRCVAQGLRAKEIAETLGKSVETVKDRLQSARYKLRARNSTHAACEAIRRGLIP